MQKKNRQKAEFHTRSQDPVHNNYLIDASCFRYETHNFRFLKLIDIWLIEIKPY